MTLAELLLDTTAIELAMTRRILDCVPEAQPQWTPHPRSMPLGKLAMHVATLPQLGLLCLATDCFNLEGNSSPGLVLDSHQQMLAVFDEGSARLHTALSSATEEQLAAHWRLLLGERVLVDKPRAVVLNHMFLGHLIHHRAQLGTYLRQLELSVPGMYGPSADDKNHAASVRNNAA